MNLGLSPELLVGLLLGVIGVVGWFLVDKKQRYEAAVIAAKAEGTEAKEKIAALSDQVSRFEERLKRLTEDCAKALDLAQREPLAYKLGQRLETIHKEVVAYADNLDEKRGAYQHELRLELEKKMEKFEEKLDEVKRTANSLRGYLDAAGIPRGDDT